MNPIGVLFAVVASVCIISLPRRMVSIPLLTGTLYMTRGPVLQLGPVNFTLIQILVLVGIIRAISKGERIVGSLNKIDVCLILWAIFLFTTSAFHTADAWIFRSGMLWVQLGSYFFFRIFVQEIEDIRYIFKTLCLLIIPLAVLMILEKSVGKNLFALLGDGRETVDFRHGHFRARGPFGHAILAGVIGATCFPMALYFWKTHRSRSIIGMLAAGGIILASTASGPIMMLLFILLGMAAFIVRQYVMVLCWSTFAGIIALDFIMKDPVYFLMARIDIAGGSTGWYRARLIQSCIEHFDEWWLGGSDYTRHWMPTGQIANPRHADFTNHFIGIGVLGGLPTMLMFILILFAAFAAVGKAMEKNVNAPIEDRFLIWTLGAILFGEVWNFFSIYLYDQSIVFLYFIFACISTMQLAETSSSKGGEQSNVVKRMQQSRYAKAKTKNKEVSALMLG